MEFKKEVFKKGGMEGKNRREISKGSLEGRYMKGGIEGSIEGL